jgi:hypothetical protein
MQLAAYTNTAFDRPPKTGYHAFHVFVIFPISVNPYKAFWGSTIANQQSKGPFTSRSLMFISGSIVGLLSPKALQEYIQPEARILIIVPHSHHFIPSDPAAYIQREAKTPSSTSNPTQRQSRFKAAIPFIKEDPSSPTPASRIIDAKTTISPTSSDNQSSTDIDSTTLRVENGMYSLTTCFYSYYLGNSYTHCPNGIEVTYHLNKERSLWSEGLLSEEFPVLQAMLG